MTRRTDEVSNNVQVIVYTYISTLGDFLDLDVNRKNEYPNFSPDVFTNSQVRLPNFDKLSAAKTTKEDWSPTISVKIFVKTRIMWFVHIKTMMP